MAYIAFVVCWSILRETTRLARLEWEKISLKGTQGRSCLSLILGAWGKPFLGSLFAANAFCPGGDGMVAQWSVDPSLRPGRYLYIQKVRSVSTWRCDSLPSGMWFNIPSHFLLLPVISLTLIGILATLQEKLTGSWGLKQGWMYLPKMSQQIRERARTRTLPFWFQSLVFFVWTAGCSLLRSLLIHTHIQHK